MRRGFLTTIVWALALASLTGAAGLAALFVLMPTSLDPVQTINAGAEPWLDAVYAVLAFLAVLAATVLALLAWHSRRFRALGAAIVLIEVGLVVWAGLQVYSEYF